MEQITEKISYYENLKRDEETRLAKLQSDVAVAIINVHQLAGAIGALTGLMNEPTKIPEAPKA